MPNRKLGRFVGVWLTDNGLDVIDNLATADGLIHNGKPNRGEMIRVLLREAIAARTPTPEPVRTRWKRP